jgi:hypothetical protein
MKPSACIVETTGHCLKSKTGVPIRLHGALEHTKIAVTRQSVMVSSWNALQRAEVVEWYLDLTSLPANTKNAATLSALNKHYSVVFLQVSTLGHGQ